MLTQREAQALGARNFITDWDRGKSGICERQLPNTADVFEMLSDF